MNWTAVTQHLEGCSRDWVGVASNCTMGLFPGRHGCFHWLLRDRSPKRGDTWIRSHCARPCIQVEHCNNMKHILSLLVVRKATENRKAYKKNNCASTFPAPLYAAWSLKGILQLLLDRWTCFSDNCWLECDVTAAMLAMFSPLRT